MRYRRAPSPTGSSNTGRSRKRSITWSWMEMTYLEQLLQRPLRHHSGAGKASATRLHYQSRISNHPQAIPVQSLNNGIQSILATAGPGLWSRQPQSSALAVSLALRWEKNCEPTSRNSNTYYALLSQRR